MSTELFEAANDILNEVHLEIDKTAEVTDWASPMEARAYGLVRDITFKQLPVKGTDAFVVVRREKHSKEESEYSLFISRSRRTMDMSLRCSEPSAIEYARFIFKNSG